VKSQNGVVFNVFVTLFILWMMLNSSLSLEIILVGIIVSVFLVHFIAPIVPKYSDIRFTVDVVKNYGIFLGVFLVELVKANLNMAKIVVSPQLNIKPGIVKINTQLKTPIGRLVLANSITLTPGTLVVDIIENTLYVHCIDVSIKNPEIETAQMIEKFEKYLKVVYG
jgi:multicomponent Na+:H+ antiporter subunit E